MAIRQFAPALLGVVAGVLLAVSGAAAEDFDFTPEQAARPHVTTNPAAAAAIPADFKFVEPGVFTVAISPYAPPIGTYATDAATVVGFDPDYASLIAESLGLKLNLVPIAWADWPLGLQSGKFDAVISNVGVTEERKEKYDFSTYRLGLHGFYVKSDSPIQSLKEPKDIAGLRLITGAGTNQERILLEWDKENKAAGLAPITLQYYDDEAAIRLAIQSGRADANFNPNAPQAYQAAKDGSIRLVGTINAGWPNRSDVAIATRKGSGLADALTIATNGLIESGVYKTALDRWKLGEEALPKSETNPPGLPKF